MRSLQVLIVDDEPAIRQILANAINKAGHSVSTADCGANALSRLSKGDVEVCICDIRMPDMTGIDVVKSARETGIETTFLMMTAFASVNTAIDAMRTGAYDYMLKPLRNEDVINRLARLGDVISLKSENRVLKEIVLQQEGNQCQMTSPAMREIERLITKVAKTDSTILITGPSGAGKGVIARSVHRNSLRSNAPFIPVNCGAIPENLLESEFFGHTKGAFTGASKAKRGLFVEADQGTIFLDEIGELPLNLQVKLLHAIEDQSVRALGSEQERKINVRIISATNKNLEEMVAAGEFREDLYFRLNVFHIHLPPLRERPEDVNTLIDFLLEQERSKLGITQTITVEPEARAMLCQHQWPGNVRELQNVIARSLIMAENDCICPEDLPHGISKFKRKNSNVLFATSGTLKDQMRAYEYALIKRTIELADGDRREAANQLGIGVSSLYRKLEEAGNAYED